MRGIEAFTEAKDPARPETNEDCVVVVPDRAFAVSDGATDKSGRRYGGLTGGRIASATVGEVVSAIAFEAEAPSGTDLVRRIGGALRDRYRALGLQADAEADPLARFSATLALAVATPRSWRFYRIGDSGIRVNGTEVLLDESPLDAIYAAFRQSLWHRFVAAGLPLDEVDRRARRRLVEGAAHSSDDASLVREARGEALDRLLPRFPLLEREQVATLLDRGLARQVDHRGAGGPFGYGPLDGWPLDDRFVRLDERPVGSVRSIELFTDGYYGIAPDPSLASWEDWHRTVQREDPHRIGRFASTKGASPGRNADDRSVVIVHL